MVISHSKLLVYQRETQEFECIKLHFQHLRRARRDLASLPGKLCEQRPGWGWGIIFRQLLWSIQWCWNVLKLNMHQIASKYHRETVGRRCFSQFSDDCLSDMRQAEMELMSWYCSFASRRSFLAKFTCFLANTNVAALRVSMASMTSVNTAFLRALGQLVLPQPLILFSSYWHFLVVVL